jgi:PII-like signaling protein
MNIVGEQVLLRLYLQSADRPPLTPTWELIVNAARQRKLAGATVLRGILGAGYHHLIQPSAWTIVEHVPVVVEIVDRGQQIAAFIDDDLSTTIAHGIATLERAAVIMHRAGANRGDIGSLQLSPPTPPLSTLPAIAARPHMTIKEDGVLLRVFIGESDRFEHKPLYQQIVQKVRELGLAGATVLRGSAGFGANSIVHKASLLEMSTDLPIVIEIVDAHEKIQLLLPHLEKMVSEGLITMEHVMIVMYRHDATNLKD